MSTTTITHQQVIDLVKTLPVERLQSLYDFTLFLRQQPVVLTPETDLFGESAVKTEGDEPQCEEEFVLSGERFAGLGWDTSDEFRAGGTQPMEFSAEGRLER